MKVKDLRLILDNLLQRYEEGSDKAVEARQALQEIEGLDDEDEVVVEKLASDAEQ